MERMLRCCCVLGVLLLFGDVYGNVPNSRVRHQVPGAQGGQLIDNIFNIPITAISQTATAAQTFSPENSQAIDTIFKIPVSTLQAVGTVVKTATEQRRQNAEYIQQNRQNRREQLLELKEQKKTQKEDLYNRRLQQRRRVVRHDNDPLGLKQWSNALFGRRGILGGHTGGLLGGHTGGLLGGHFNGMHGLHGHGHGHGQGHGQGGLLGNRPQHTYEVHEDINDDTSFYWHGLTAGFGTIQSNWPFHSEVKIENKIAPKEKSQKGLTNDYVIPQNKIAKMKSKPIRKNDDPPIENKIAPRNGKVTFA